VAIAGFMGIGIKEASKSSESQPLQVARSCEGGILAALFAGQGAKGADTMLENGFLRAFAGEGADPKWLEQIGRDYLINEIYTKVHGGCRGNHAPVDVVQNIVREHGIRTDDIAAIEVRVDTVTYAAEIHHPANGNQAQFSVGFACAAALVQGDASIFQYTDARLAEPAMQAMMGKIKVIINKELDQFYPVLRPAEAVITLKDGQRFEGYIDNAKGEPEHPFSPAEIEGKFLALTREALPGKGEQVRDVVMRLDSVNNVGELTRLLVRS
jgi:2-methylcitrate dehydratase PrpD